MNDQLMNFIAHQQLANLYQEAEHDRQARRLRKRRASRRNTKPTRALLPYPHSRNDCQECRERDADMIISLPRPRAGDRTPIRCCQSCAGPLLARMVDRGITAAAAPVKS